MGHSSSRLGFLQRDAGFETAQVLYLVAFKIWLAAVTVFVRNRAKRNTFADRVHRGPHQRNGGPCPAVLLAVSCRRDQRRSCNTLACDWLASASAETAIDWRVASAWLLAASSLVSASVRLADPVCSTLIRFFEKSWRICTIDRFGPSVEASVRSAFDALLILAIVALAEALSRKSVPATSGARPRPAASKVTPWMFRMDLPVSLKVSLRSSPFSRLMPLNEASCEVVVICVMTLLYWVTRLARMASNAAAATGFPALPPAGVTSANVPLPLSATIFAATVVPRVRIRRASSLVEVR